MNIGREFSSPGLSVLLALCFERVPVGLTGPAYALLVRVGTHAKGSRHVAKVDSMPFYGHTLEILSLF